MALHADTVVYVERSGGFSETTLPDGKHVQKNDSDDVYATIQMWAKKNHKPVKVVDTQKEKRLMVDRDGNIEDMDDTPEHEVGSSPLMMRRDYGSKSAAEGDEPDPVKVLEALKKNKSLLKAIDEVIYLTDTYNKSHLPDVAARSIFQQIIDLGLGTKMRKTATEGPGTDPNSLLESMKSDSDLNEIVRQMLNERLVSSISEARRLAQEGYSVEELRKIRGGKNMAKGKWSSECNLKHIEAAGNRETFYVSEGRSKPGVVIKNKKGEVIDSFKSGWSFDPELHADKIKEYARKNNCEILVFGNEQYLVKPNGDISLDRDISRDLEDGVVSAPNWLQKEMQATATKRLDILADRLEMHGMREAAEKLDVISNTLEASWRDPQKAIDNVKKAMNLLGWQGGTVHQVADETGLTIEQIHTADDIEALVRDALKKKGKTPKQAAELVGTPYVVEQLNRAGFKTTRYPCDIERSNESHIKALTHAKTSSWNVEAPADKVFVVDGVELEDLILNVPGSAMKEEDGDFRGESSDDFKYLIYKPTPKADMAFKNLVFGVNKEQELILKLKAMLKPAGLAKKASHTDDPTIDEMRTFLKKEFGGLVDKESLENDGTAAMHWFANDYHGGQWTELYKVFSLGFKPGPSHNSVKDEGEVASDMYDALKKEYAGKSIPEKYSGESPPEKVQEGMVFPIQWSNNPDHPELKKVFSWLTRHHMGPAFGSRPISWYQGHQINAIDIIEEAVKKHGGSGRVRVQKGDLMAEKDGKWEKLMSTEDVYRKADKR